MSVDNEETFGLSKEGLTQFLNLTWSCLLGGPKHCGKCVKCISRKARFKELGVEDRTEYAE